MKKGMKDALAPQGLFEDLGLKYVGPVDGHDRAAHGAGAAPGEAVRGPVIVHVMTRKGFGYGARGAARGGPDALPRRLRHRDRGGDAQGAAAGPTSSPRRWSRSARSGTTSSRSPRRCCYPVGLDRFAAAYPDRTFDVGIAEQHAATSAAGLALGGLHPVVAVYATFLNRAFDQVLMDVAMHRLGVTFVLDRAGVTGDDGASHNGMWDMSVAPAGARPPAGGAPRRDPAPRAAARGRRGRRRAHRGALPEGRRRRRPRGRRHGSAASTSWSATAPATCWSSGSARWRGRPSTWPTGWPTRASASPSSTRAGSSRYDPAIVGLARDHRLVVSVEDNGIVGGCGAVLLQTLNGAGSTTPVRLHGIPQEFLDHAKRARILERVGLTAAGDRPAGRRGLGALDRRPRGRAGARGLASRPGIGP